MMAAPGAASADTLAANYSPRQLGMRYPLWRRLWRYWLVRKACLVQRAPHAAGGFRLLHERGDIGKRVRPVLRDGDRDGGLLKAAVDNARARQLRRQWRQRVARKSEGVGFVGMQQGHGLLDRCRGGNRGVFQ